MSIWLEAARKARCQTDRTDKTDRTAKTPSIQPDPAPHTDASAEVLSVLSVCQFEGNSPPGPADPPRAFSITGEPQKASRNLPTHPPTCAACSLADWRVSVTEPDGRRLHVACWKTEGGQA